MQFHGTRNVLLLDNKFANDALLLTCPVFQIMKKELPVFPRLQNFLWQTVGVDAEILYRTFINSQIGISSHRLKRTRSFFHTNHAIFDY